MIAPRQPDACRCPECRDLDNAHPTEGEQLTLLDLRMYQVKPFDIDPPEEDQPCT